ncbi:MAG: AAA family ATPase [Coleofasciculus chthonoplastes F3-SA18-01]|uniref:AAA family ATPase n=1 Tax=Coleofasciculus chthonoplastes TaxID=64178 RepID=UPI0032FCE9D1
MFSYLSLENFSCFAKFELQNITKINVVIGINDTGKTHLLKLLYTIAKSIEEFTKRTESDQPDWREVLAEKLFWVYQPDFVKPSRNYNLCIDS